MAAVVRQGWLTFAGPGMSALGVWKGGRSRVEVGDQGGSSLGTGAEVFSIGNTGVALPGAPADARPAPCTVSFPGRLSGAHGVQGPYPGEVSGALLPCKNLQGAPKNSGMERNHL